MMMMMMYVIMVVVVMEMLVLLMVTMIMVVAVVVMMRGWKVEGLNWQICVSCLDLMIGDWGALHGIFSHLFARYFMKLKWG